jgi:methyl-accepting chemotaxis protein
VDLGALGVHAVMLSVNVAIAQLDPVKQQNAALAEAAAASASLKAQALQLEGVVAAFDSA